MQLKSLIFCSVTLLGLQSNVIAPYTADIETFFLPQSQEDIYARLSSLLDTAKKQVLIAMYWLTDEVVFNKLIELKRHGIDVQIIFDDSMTDWRAHLQAFIVNNIIPVVSPTRNGKMHNKFVVIDNSAVWTGSANFTPKVLIPSTTFFNDENIVIINSPIAAEQYSNAFNFIEKNIITVYIQNIAAGTPRNLLIWLIPLCQRLYQSNRLFKELLHELAPKYDYAGQANLFSAFPAAQAYLQQVQTTRDEEMEENVEESSIETTTEEAVWPNEQIQSSQTDEPSQEEAWEDMQESYMEEATPAQKRFLKKRDFDCYVSKRDATEMIKEIMETEKRTGQKYLHYPYD